MSSNDNNSNQTKDTASSTTSTSNKEGMIAVCLKMAATTTNASSRTNSRHILKIAPTASLQELYDQSRQLFVGTESSHLELKHGVPPNVKVLDPSLDVTLQQAGIQNQDRILVFVVQNEEDSCCDQEDAKKKKGRGSKKKKTAKEEEEDGKRAATRSGSKRAAAVAAKASFAETIRQQDRMLQQEKKQNKKKVDSSSPVKNKATITTKRSSPTTHKPRFAAASTAGRRLQDGAQVTSRKKPRQSPASSSSALQQQQLSSEDAGAMALLGAAEGANASSASRLMRRNWKQAVNDAYEQNQAVARLAAIASQKVEFSTTTTTADGGGTSTDDVVISSLTVTYPRGVQGRGHYTDRVDFLPFDVLESVIAAIYPSNPEALRPENLALLSPRVLWSLVYHLVNATNADGATTTLSTANSKATSVEAALRHVQRDLDWSFLRRRKEQLSEKALENLRQEQEAAASLRAGAGGEQGGNDNDKWEAAARAIESVELAMANLETLDRTQRAARLLQAASNRMVWKVVTPTETDEDELKECIGDTVPTMEQVPSLIQSLVHLGIRNWRELANVNADQLALQMTRHQNRNNKSNNKCNKDNDAATTITSEVVTSWIDKAQDETLEEIMVEVCQGNVAGVELLRTIQSGTPKDLATWRLIVPVLCQTLQEEKEKYPAVGVDHDDDDNTDTAATTTVRIPSQEELQQWCDRAQQALEQFEWLNLFTTPL